LRGKKLPAHSVWQKNQRSISPTIKTPNFNLNWHFLPNTVCQTKPLILCLKKPRGMYVDEMDPSCQFHQHFMQAFFANILAPKITKLTFGFETFWQKDIGKKCACKMLMKWTPGRGICPGVTLLKRQKWNLSKKNLSIKTKEVINLAKLGKIYVIFFQKFGVWRLFSSQMWLFHAGLRSLS